MWITINSHALRRRPSAPPVHNIGNDKFPGYMVCARFRYAVVRVEHSAHYIPHIDHSTNPGTKNIAYNTATVHIHVVYDMCMCFHSRMGDRVWCWLVGVLCVCVDTSLFGTPLEAYVWIAKVACRHVQNHCKMCIHYTNFPQWILPVCYCFAKHQ